MSVINKLKLVISKRQTKLSPTAFRRHKLCSKIAEQLAMAKAKKEGKAYAATKLKRVVDAETGIAIDVEVTKRLKEWYWVENNKVQFQIMYGTKPLTLNAKGANTIELASGDELINTLEVLLEAVGAGELDEAIESASKSLRERFDK
jgi:hypothetical protein